jgi:CheY-like chemotaxis protein
MPSGGTINISTENYIESPEKLYVKMIIEDHGIGIQKEYLSKIFDPYFTTKQTGSGLGLSVCHSIITRHEGKIYIDSKIGEGTTFTILLPATRQDVSIEKEAKKSIEKKLDILIMDDETEVRELLTSMLKKQGHKVTSSKEGNECVNIYKNEKEKENPFDLVIMDLTVKGGLGGKEALIKLREYDKNAKVIVSSGYADSAIANYKDYGFDGMLKKPYTLDELNIAIFNAMNR